MSTSPIITRARRDDVDTTASFLASACTPAGHASPPEPNCHRSDHHQPPASLSKRRSAQNPSRDRRPRLHAQLSEEERPRTIRSKSDGSVPIRLSRIRADRRTWAGLAQPRSPDPILFFQRIVLLICKSLQCLKFHENYSVHPKIVIQISVESLCCMITIPMACVIFRIIDIIW
jgi:hypothetical protein